MAGITGLGTTYGLPNYTGELINLTPSQTPILNIAGRNPGQVPDWELEWQTKDRRANAQNVALEGADAPTAVARVRANVTNVTEIHQSAVQISYTKLAATGRMSGVAQQGTANPVTNEVAEQVTDELASMGRDVEFSFLHGRYNKPTDNTTARKTRGLIPAITTNVVNKGTLLTGVTSATDTLTKSSHGLSDGDRVVFTDMGTLADGVVNPQQAYYVVSAATTFKVSATSGGSAITLGTATGIKITKVWSTALTYDHLGEFIQGVYDNGGMRGGENGLLVNSRQKRAVTKAIAGAFGQADPVMGTIGGVTVETVITDFGPLSVILHDLVPVDSIVASSLNELRAVFTEIPGKGHMFAEPLAKTGASEKVQLYGEVGLKYGAEQHHGILRGLAL